MEVKGFLRPVLERHAQIDDRAGRVGLLVQVNPEAVLTAGDDGCVSDAGVREFKSPRPGEALVSPLRQAESR